MAKESEKELQKNPRFLLDLKGKNKGKYALISFVTVVVLTIIFYFVPDYFFLEKITSDTVFEALKLYRYAVIKEPVALYYWEYADAGNGFFDNFIFFVTGLDGHDGMTPVIRSANYFRRFAVVRACTGMQAGALLMALIIVTPADFRKKIKATAYSTIALVLGNFLRIALTIGMTLTLMDSYGVGYDEAWMWSHNVLGKPIGFFGTIFFALIIEKQGVPILNTVSLWIDSILGLFSSKKKKKFLVLFSKQKKKDKEVSVESDKEGKEKEEKVKYEETVTSENKKEDKSEEENKT